MSIGWARSVLTAYRWGGALAYPAVGAYLALRTSRGKEDRTRVMDRWSGCTRQASARRRPSFPCLNI
jgi:3-deoxy-D-manno-octulosonic-acid transferase